MTIGKKLRDLRDKERLEIIELLRNWFDKNMDKLIGSAQLGCDCIEFSEEETFNFWSNILDRNEMIVREFLDDEEIEVELSYDYKKVAISWNEMFCRGGGEYDW